MRTLLRDVRFGLRRLRRDPGLAVAAVLTLGLAIGANTAIFSVTSAVLLRPFPYAHPQQLVSITPHDATEPTEGTLLRYELLRDRAKTLTVAAWTTDNLNLTGAGEPVQLPVARVTPNFFSLLGVQPQLGRTFVAADGQPESKPVVLLSHALWRSRFGSDPDVVGRAIDLDGIPSVVAGVLPAGVGFPFVGRAEVWTPRYFELTLMPAARLRLGVGYLSYIGRLAPGVSLAQANAELAVLNERYIRENPGLADSSTATVMTAAPLRELVVAGVREKIWILTGAVALLLLIGCANVASLLLSRALARRREMAIRSALGAGRAVLFRQLLTESLLLAVASGGSGVLLAWAADRALEALATGMLPQGLPVTVDAPVLLFAVGVTALTGIAAGLFPAVQVARTNLNATLRDEGRGVSGDRSRARVRSSLVVGQVALSLLLLIGAGLLVRSFARLLHTDPGFEARSVLTMGVSLPTEKYTKPQQQIDFFREVLRRVDALPGVRSAAVSAALPLETKRITPMLPEGQPAVPLAQRPFLDVEAVSPGWFRTLEVPLLAGREFGDADDADAPKVTIVNEAFARRFWPGENPVGKTVTIGRWTEPAQVVGVAEDVHNRGLAAAPQAQIYLPFAQLPWGDMNLLVRTAVAPLSLAPAVEAQVSAVDPDQPATDVRALRELMDADRAQPRLTMLLLAAFSATALLLAAIGLAAMLAWSTVQRRQELAIRLALGAERRDLMWLVVSQGLTLAGTGIAVGLAAGLALTRLMSSALYRTSAHDLRTFVFAPLVLLGVAGAASLIPARRALRVDPIESLRG